LDISKIREDFPILRRKIGGRRLIYFDNAATSQRPIHVINAVRRFYEEYNANVHRGIHVLSEEASEMYEEAHDVVAEFIGARSREEIIFVRNTTEGLNLVAYSYGLRNIRRGDEIVITIMEHHSNMLPWVMLAERTGARLRVIDISRDTYLLDYDSIPEIINERTRIVAIGHASNVLGAVNDVEYVCRVAKEYDAVVVVDGAQSVPHILVDVGRIRCDFMAFSGHKMLGPTGIGVLYVRRDLLDDMDPFLRGGGMISSVELDTSGRYNIVWGEYPWRFEAGTPNIAGAIGLVEAIKYLRRIGMKSIEERERELVRYTLQRMSEDLEGYVRVYGPEPRHRVGIVPFNIEGMDPHVVALYLSEYGICVRSGFHCAQPLHMRLDLKNGTVRASYYFYNTEEEIDYFIDTLREIVERKKE